MRIHDPASGALLASHTTRERRLSGVANANPVVVSVRPLCDALLGPATYLYAD